MQERELFIAAIEIDDPSARRQFLERTCVDNPKLRERIERLLARVTEAAGFLDHPAADLCADSVQDFVRGSCENSRTDGSPTVIIETNGTASSPYVLPPELLETQYNEANGAATQGERIQTALVPETLFGRYRVERVLGSGGMGVVYLTRDTRLDRQVALKIPRFDADGKLHLIERFRREARVMASVQHRNLCPIINVDEQDGQHYLTMAYISGKPLSHLIRNGSSFPAAQIAEWICKLAMALDTAHRAGVVHRDLKPANIIIDQSGEPILMDFGLAWMAHETDSRVTLAGNIIGTPAYMSPEQANCEAERVGGTSDIYSLGVIMYELLAGRPIRTGSVTRVLYKLMHETPLRPSEIRGGVDLQLEEICWKAIARRPNDRFATAAEFAAAITAILPQISDGGVSTQLQSEELRRDRKHRSGEALPFRNVEGIVDRADVHPSQEDTGTVASERLQTRWRVRKLIVLAGVLLLGILAVTAPYVNGLFGETLQTPLIGAGKHLPLAPIGKTLAAVNPSYEESPISFTGTWSANAKAAWRGTYTADGCRPVGVVYPAGVARYDFTRLANHVLPAGTYFTVYSLNVGDHFTLKAYDSTHTVISSPWLNSNPHSQWGSGSGSGFPGRPVLANMPGWNWSESTGTYSLDGNSVDLQSILTIALSSREDISFLQVTRGSTGCSFNLLAPAAADESSSSNHGERPKQTLLR